LSLWPLQIVYRRRPRTTVYVRLAPANIWFPTEHQRRVREIFAEAARLARGLKGLAPDGLPWAAHFVREALRGRRIGRKKRVARWELVYGGWVLEAARLGYFAPYTKLYRPSASR